MAVTISPTIHHEQIRIANPPALVSMVGATMPALEDTRWPGPLPKTYPADSRSRHAAGESSNAELYPVSLTGVSGNVVLHGGTIMGKMNPLAPWHLWKNYSDGAGVRFEGSGLVEARFQHISNVEDGYDPRARFNIHDVYLDTIHDDMVENDGIFSGSISNSYMRGFTFLSARPTRGTTTSHPDAVVKISNVVVELQLLPVDGSKSASDVNTQGGYPFPDGLGAGAIFKFQWGSTASGKVEVSDSVFLVHRPSMSSNKSMQFPPGTYKNVTVVWLGVGDYPAPVPAGVTITRDRGIFDRAVDAFFKAHPMFTREGADNATVR